MRTYIAPAAFLLAVTVAVLAIHYTVQSHHTARVANVVHTVHRRAHRHRAAAAAVTRYVVVQRGDSFSAIAARTHVDVPTLESLNPSVSPKALRVGQRIRVK